MASDLTASQRHALAMRYLGDEIAELRRAKSWTQSDLAGQLTMSHGETLHPKTIATYEQGVRMMTVLRLLELCHLLDGSAPGVLARAVKLAGHGKCPTCGSLR